jgi:hypothetical protein
VDLSKLTRGEQLIVGGGIVYLIAMFLPWYDRDILLFGRSTGWDDLLGGIVPLLLIAAMAARVLLTRYSPATPQPRPPIPWPQLHLALGVAVGVILVLRTLIDSDVHGGGETIARYRQYGLFVALLAALAVAGGGVLKFLEANPPPQRRSPEAR